MALHTVEYHRGGKSDGNDEEAQPGCHLDKFLWWSRAEVMVCIVTVESIDG